GQQQAQVFGVQALAPVQVEVAGGFGQRQFDRSEGGGHLLEPGAADNSRVGSDTGFSQAHFVVAGSRQLDGEAPQCRDGGKHALAAFFGAAAQSLYPLAGATQVVGDFLQCLGGNTGNTRV